MLNNIDYNLLGTDYRYIDVWTYALDVQQAKIAKERQSAREITDRERNREDLYLYGNQT